MSENREFIAANELPITEEKEVNVLVVNPATGELAQKPGAKLGGGGYVFKLKPEDATISSGSSANIIVTIDCTELVHAILEGKFVQISIPQSFTDYLESRTISPVMELYVEEGVLCVDTWCRYLKLVNTPIPSVLQE